jgi:multidrug resistance efflux pump
MKTKALLVAALALAVGGIWVYLPHAVSGPSLGDPGATGDLRAPPGRGDEGDRWIQGQGYVEPVSEVRRLVFPADGVIGECRVEVGRRVARGEVLMVLRNGEQRAAVALAERELRLARAEAAKVLSGAHPNEIAAAPSKVEWLQEQARHLRGELERNRRAFAGRAVTDQEYEQSRTSLIQKEAALAYARAELRRLKHQVRPEDRDLAGVKVGQAEARLELAQQRLQHTFLLAPCRGMVLEIFKRAGEGQRPTDRAPVMVFGNLSRLRVRAEIDERYARRVRVGQEAVAFGRGLGAETFPGRVVAVRRLMGKKTVFSRAATERRDLDVVQVLIDLGATFSAPVGLQVDVRINIGH